MALVYHSTAAGQSCFLKASLPLFFSSVASASELPMAATRTGGVGSTCWRAEGRAGRRRGIAQGRSGRGAASKQRIRKALGEAVGRDTTTRAAHKNSRQRSPRSITTPRLCPPPAAPARQPVSDLRRPEQAKLASTTMVSRGRAVVVKKNKYKDVCVDDDGDEVSPPSSPEGATVNSELS